MSGLISASPAEPRLSRNEVLARCEYFSQVALWPAPRITNPQAWMGNFTDDEQPVAVALLNSLLYFNDELTDLLLVAAIRGLAPTITNEVTGYHAKQARWIEFLASVRLTHLRPPKDDGDETKSGFLFVRKARQQLALPNEQVLPAANVLAAVAAGDTRPVVIVTTSPAPETHSLMDGSGHTPWRADARLHSPSRPKPVPTSSSARLSARRTRSRESRDSARRPRRCLQPTSSQER